jgi:vesicle transport protein SEC22
MGGAARRAIGRTRARGCPPPPPPTSLSLTPLLPTHNPIHPPPQTLLKTLPSKTVGGGRVTRLTVDGSAAPSNGAGPSSSSSTSSAPIQFHYLLSPDGVAFLVAADRGYPKKLAFQYLDELAGEFGRLYPAETVAGASRPYACIKFDTFIQRTRRLYADARTQRNLASLNAELGEVAAIMTRNIADVLGQGDRLDAMAAASATLAAETAGYARRARALHRQALIRKYVPPAVLVGALLFVLWLRRRVYG